jgi:hypothetical protein
MLEKASDKLLRREGECFQAAVVAAAEAESDPIIFILKYSLGAQGGAINIVCQVAESGLAAAHGKAIHDPVKLPDLLRDQCQQWRTSQGLLEPIAETHGQDFFRQEKVRVLDALPLEVIRGQATARDHEMNMRVKDQLAGPGVENTQEPELSAQVFWMGGNLLQDGRAFGKKQAIKLFLVGPNDIPQLLRNSESHQEIRNRQQTVLLRFNPLLGLGVAALGASSVVAGMISEVFAATEGATKKLTTQSGRTTAQDRLHCSSMRGQQGRSKALLIRRPMAAEHFSQLDHLKGSAWECGVEFFQSLTGLFFAGGGQMGIDYRGVQGGMAQILADQPQADSLFQEMSGVTVAQSVNHRFGVDATLDPGQLNSALHRGNAHRCGGLFQHF